MPHRQCKLPIPWEPRHDSDICASSKGLRYLVMTRFSLTQSEADALLGLEKRRSDTNHRDYPGLGGRISVPLTSMDGRERFVLDLHRSQINLAKGTYQNRGRHDAILARLDFGGPPHRNPDDEEIGSPHLHLYREGFEDKWAFPVPLDRFPNLHDRWQTLADFMRFCNIVEPPYIQRGLFP